MSARILVLCLLSSVISTAASLKCQTCFACGDQCRNEDMQLVECEADEKYCLSFSFRSTMTSVPLSFTAKSCTTADQCANAYYSITSVTGKYKQTRLACCENDGCNTAPLPMPGRDVLKPNGFVCPGSFEQNGVSGESGQVLCLGDEDQCYNSKFSLRALSTYFSTVKSQGCTTKNTCLYPIGKTKEGNGLIFSDVETLKCQDPQALEGWRGFSKTLGRSWN